MSANTTNHNNPLNARKSWSRSDLIQQQRPWDSSQTAPKQRKVYAIHIGVNHTLPGAYRVPMTQLEACREDARTYFKVSEEVGHNEKVILLDEKASRKNLFYLLEKYAGNLTKGDLLWLTFSGHGGLVPDASKRERNGTDQCWCLYDGYVTDDELCKRFARFKKGVRIFVIADSCFSGHMLEEAFNHQNRKDARLAKRAARRRAKGLKPKFRCEDNTVINAHIFLMSACQSDGKSYQSKGKSVFTRAVSKTWKHWKKKRIHGSYLEFWQAASDVTYGKQVPTYQIIGPKTPWTTQKTPFDID